MDGRLFSSFSLLVRGNLCVLRLVRRWPSFTFSIGHLLEGLLFLFSLLPLVLVYFVLSYNVFTA